MPWYIIRASLEIGKGTFTPATRKWQLLGVFPKYVYVFTHGCEIYGARKKSYQSPNASGAAPTCYKELTDYLITYYVLKH